MSDKKIKEVDYEGTFVKCPQCKKDFALVWESFDNVNTIDVSACPSGGVYNVSISCPYCDYEEEL